MLYKYFIIFNPPAVRAATFGSWRMLTLGVEYEDTWALTPDRKRGLSKSAEEDPGPAEEAGDDPGEPTWRAVHRATEQKYDTVLHLDGVTRAAARDGVRRALWRHDTLNESPLIHRSDRLLKTHTPAAKDEGLCRI